MEGWLSIDVTGDGVGHMTIDCELRDEPGIGNKLKFSLATDQTFVRPMVESLQATIAAFPVVGRLFG